MHGDRDGRGERTGSLRIEEVELVWKEDERTGRIHISLPSLLSD